MSENVPPVVGQPPQELSIEQVVTVEVVKSPTPPLTLSAPVPNPKTPYIPKPPAVSVKPPTVTQPPAEIVKPPEPPKPTRRPVHFKLPPCHNRNVVIRKLVINGFEIEVFAGQQELSLNVTGSINVLVTNFDAAGNALGIVEGVTYHE